MPSQYVLSSCCTDLAVDSLGVNIELLCVNESQLPIDDENVKIVPATSSSADQDTHPHTGPLGMTRNTYALGNHKSQTETLPQLKGHS